MARPKKQPDPQPVEENTASAEAPQEEESNAPEESAETAVATLDELPGPLQALPTEFKEKVALILQKFNPEKKGLMGDVNKKRFAPTRIKVRQPTTQSCPDDLPMGSIFTTDFDNLGKELSFIPISGYFSRTKWPSGQTTSENSECYSNNAVVGHWGAYDLRSCEPLDGSPGCPYRLYDSVAKKYPCNKILNVIGMSPNLEEFYQIQFSGVSFKVGRKFVDKISARREIFDSVYKIKTAKQATNSSYEYVMPETVKRFENGAPEMVIADFFSNLLDKEWKDNLEREKRQLAGENVGGVGSDFNVDSGEVYDDEEVEHPEGRGTANFDV